MRSLFFAIFLLIAFFAFSPEKLFPTLILHQDKYLHAAAFFTLSFLLHRAFCEMRLRHIVLLMGLWAMGIELLQLLFTQRQFSWEDMLFGLLGTLLYVLPVQLLRFSVRNLGSSGFKDIPMID